MKLTLKSQCIEGCCDMHLTSSQIVSDSVVVGALSAKNGAFIRL